jgi:hypothetical protein
MKLEYKGTFFKYVRICYKNKSKFPLHTAMLTGFKKFLKDLSLHYNEDCEYIEIYIASEFEDYAYTYVTTVYLNLRNFDVEEIYLKHIAPHLYKKDVLWYKDRPSEKRFHIIFDAYFKDDISEERQRELYNKLNKLD